MSVTPITNPFDGERVVGLSPTPAARVTDWNRRLNLFTGRALSAAALIAEQDGQAGRLALRGQMVSPGVVQGFEAALETPGATPMLNIAGGYGLCASGEDVFLGTHARVPLGSLPVFTTAQILDGAPPLQAGELGVRRLGPTLAELIAKHAPLPLAGIVVLQPVAVDQLANFDAADPCPADTSAAAFADEQLLDGVRLVFYTWPDEWLLLPAPGDRWRNRLAYAIFEREAANGPDQVMPWEDVGLPIGLVGLDNNFAPLFVDRYAVVRQGGFARRRVPITPGAGHEFLWQARIQQFAGQVTDLTAAIPDPAAMAQQFRYLPPAGLLPNSAVTFLTGANAVNSRIAGAPFFPGTWAVDAIPAPIEQLDLLAKECGSLAALDTFAPAQVTVVVPVPQIWYEPDLLEVLKIDPVFQQTVDQFSHVRSLWLKRRADVRTYDTALTTAATAVAPVFPNPDPDAVDTDEAPATSEIDATLAGFTTVELTYGATTNAAGALTVDAAVSLKASLANMPGVKDELPQLEKLGLRKFADLLQQKADQADDKIDLGFLRVQTDIYRTRQKMLSTEAATRLAISPALASIAEGASALATKDDITTFLQNAKNALNQPAPSTAPAAPAAPSAPSAAFILSKSIVPLESSGLKIATKGTVAQNARVRELSGSTQLFNAALVPQAVAGVGDVTQQRAIVGATYNLRTTSVVERLQDPPTAEIKNFTVASKYSAISNFRSGGMSVGDISIPGFLSNGAETRLTFGQITDATLGEVLAGVHDPVPDHPDESHIFAAGVRSMENTIEILRLMEGRVQLYRDAADAARKALDAVNGNAAAAGARLQAIANNLAQSRHDVAMAKALMAEETERIAGINARRDQIVSTQVKFLAYYRPRALEARNDLPVRTIDPGLSSQTIPTCLARNIAAPDELRAYVNLLREAPLNWFRYVPPLLDKFDRLDILQSVVQNATLRAGFKLAQSSEPALQTSPGPLGPAILNVYAARQQVITTNRMAVSQLDLSTFAGISWSASKASAVQVLSVGDLVDLGHYHPEVPRVSAAEIESILKVSACLYSDFSAVLPVLRLDWAARLLQIGETLNLANLASLPRWSDVPVLERKEMQAIVDWLFSRIDSSQPAAVSHINDLVKVCILLASHAPVADIIAGDVIRDTAISPGVRIDLSADLGRVKLGMHVLMYQGSAAVARGVVEDLSAGVATARVLTAASSGITLTSGTQVHFAAPDAFDRNPLTAGLL